MKEKFFKLLYSKNLDDHLILQELVNRDQEYRNLALKLHELLNITDGGYPDFSTIDSALTGYLGNRKLPKDKKAVLRRLGYDTKRLKK